MNADMTFPSSLNGSIWSLTQFFAASQPAQLSICPSIRYNPASDTIITANFIYAGPQAKGIAFIQPFLDLQPLNLSISTVAWSDIPAVASYGAIEAIGCDPGINYVPPLQLEPLRC